MVLAGSAQIDVWMDQFGKGVAREAASIQRERGDKGEFGACKPDRAPARGYAAAEQVEMKPGFSRHPPSRRHLRFVNAPDQDRVPRFFGEDEGVIEKGRQAIFEVVHAAHGNGPPVAGPSWKPRRSVPRNPPLPL